MPPQQEPDLQGNVRDREGETVQSGQHWFSTLMGMTAKPQPTLRLAGTAVSLALIATACSTSPADQQSSEQTYPERVIGPTELETLLPEGDGLPGNLRRDEEHTYSERNQVTVDMLESDNDASGMYGAPFTRDTESLVKNVDSRVDDIQELGNDADGTQECLVSLERYRDELQSSREAYLEAAEQNPWDRTLSQAVYDDPDSENDIHIRVTLESSETIRGYFGLGESDELAVNRHLACAGVGDGSSGTEPTIEELDIGQTSGTSSEGAESAEVFVSGVYGSSNYIVVLATSGDSDDLPELETAATSIIEEFEDTLSAATDEE